MNVVSLRQAHTSLAAPTHTLLTVHHMRTARRVHLLDIENLCGTSHLTENMVAYVVDAYRREVGIGSVDHLVVGVSHHNALAVGRILPHARLCVRSGADGADLALLDILDREQLEERFVEICLGSGDGIFTNVAVRTAVRGGRVRVVAGLAAASRRLRLAAGTFTQLSFTSSSQEHA